MLTQHCYQTYKTTKMLKNIHPTRAIINRGLYTFYPLFEVEKHFLRFFFLKILALCMVSIQEERIIVARDSIMKKYTPYARHHNPRFVYFLPTF